jgi:Predicted membrane protein (DUF2339)
MEDFLLAVILVGLFVRWLIMSRKLDRMDERIDDASIIRTDPDLVKRIFALETAVQELRATVRPEPPPAPAPVAAPPIEIPATEPPPVSKTTFCPLCGRVLPEGAVCECRTIETQTETPPPLPYFTPEPVSTPEPVTAPPLEEIPVAGFAMSSAPAGPSFSERMRESMKGEEWEAIIGGSWLNKLGVFVLVIGIALFLGYSFTHVGPGGQAAIGLGVSLAMLTGGFVLEKRAHYKIFARGLLGGGWAALYFTTYAMQAVDSAKVIYNPVLGGLLLIAVAAGMIVHSLRYASQTVTGLAYFVAFVTLAITPVTTLSVIALVPLAASLLYVAHRFAWPELALLGLLATYGTCASRGDSGAPVWSAQAVFTTYWLLFEGFDLLRAARRPEYSPWESAILPLNAIAFGGLTYFKWSSAAPQHLYAVAGAVAAVYLLSTVLRALLRPPSSFAPEASTLERAMSGGYEGPISVTAILSVAAIFLKFHGVTALFGLLAEAELFFLAGLFFREAYPRQLASAIFAGSLVKLITADIPAGGKTNIGNWSVNAWTPVTAATALLFYINRALRKADTFYGYAGSAVVALILGFEMPEAYLGLSWFVFAVVLFVFGWLRRLTDFRIQGYLGAMLGIGGTAVHFVNVATGAAPPLRHPWIALSLTTLISYAGVLCGLRSAADRLHDWERTGLSRVGSWASTIGLLALVWRVAPENYLGVCWMALTLPLLELGLRRLPQEFRIQSYVVALLGAVRVVVFNLIPITNDGPIDKRLMLAGAALIAYLIAARVYSARKEAIPASESNRVFDLSSATGTLFLLTGLWALLPAVAIGPAWAILALLLMELGFILDIPSLRLQANVSGAASVGRLFFANFTGFGRVGILSHRVLTVVPVIAAHYYEWSRHNSERSRLRQWEIPLSRWYLYSAAILAVALMRFELGRVFTVTGWAAFAVGLLVCGQRWNNVDLRWQSYVLAALAFWRSWNTNFYVPDSFAGVPGRIATGAFVIACFYAAQLLIPRKQDEKTGLERHARTYYSLLAAVLLSVLLYYEVSGSMLTVAWGIEGIALLIAGFPLNDRVQRLTGLALFLVCILKLFVYDLRHLETMYRILSFIVLGLMLVSVSWLYTRFRDRIQRYL